jgi:release factor glutamine methyltransferase
MTLNNLKTIFLSELSPIYPSQEIQSFFHLLMEGYLNMKRVDLALEPNKKISSETEQKFNSALLKLKKEYPIQYIIGATEFYGLTFKVNEDVLIPRPETEELVDWIIKETKEEKKKNKDLNILDVGTGSGCIAISLAKNLTDAEVWAVDISQKALLLAKENAKKNDVKINFKVRDILKTTDLESKFDIIVSNPPYIRELEKKHMQNNVLKYEPGIALFVKDKNPLLFYDKISDLAIKSLNPNGKLFFEINQALGIEVYTLLIEKGFKKIELKNDIYGENRMVKAEYH